MALLDARSVWQFARTAGAKRKKAILEMFRIRFPRAQRKLRLRNGAPGEIRTPDLTLRRRSLYPAELRARELILAVIKTGVLGSKDFLQLVTALARRKFLFELPCFCSSRELFLVHQSPR